MTHWWKIVLRTGASLANSLHAGYFSMPFSALIIFQFFFIFESVSSSLKLAVLLGLIWVQSICKGINRDQHMSINVSVISTK